MAEIVLRWRPERRASSARDISASRRMMLRAMRRLMCRAVSLVATVKLVRSILRIASDAARAPACRTEFVAGRNYMDDERRCQGRADATLNGRELTVADYLSDHVVPFLVGRDPSRVEDIWQLLYKGAYWRRGPVTMTAIGAVDMALWDIKGKALGAPVYQLLGRTSSPPACSFTRVTPRASAWTSTRRRPINIRTDGPACPWRGWPTEPFTTGETGWRGSSHAEQRGESGSRRTPSGPQAFRFDIWNRGEYKRHACVLLSRRTKWRAAVSAPRKGEAYGCGCKPSPSV